MKLRFRNILLSVIVIIIVFSLVKMLFRKDEILIKEIYNRSFNDTIASVYQVRLEKGSAAILTDFKSIDTPVFLNGSNDIRNILYVQIASKGDVLIKEAYNDSFYLKKGVNIIGFKLLKPRSP